MSVPPIRYFFNQAGMTVICPSESFNCRSDTFILCSRLYWPQNKYYLDALHKSKLRRLSLSSLSCKEQWSHENSSGAGGVFKSLLRRWVNVGAARGEYFKQREQYTLDEVGRRSWRVRQEERQSGAHWRRHLQQRQCCLSVMRSVIHWWRKQEGDMISHQARSTRGAAALKDEESDNKKAKKSELK